MIDDWEIKAIEYRSSINQQHLVSIEEIIYVQSLAAFKE